MTLRLHALLPTNTSRAVVDAFVVAEHLVNADPFWGSVSGTWQFLFDVCILLRAAPSAALKPGVTRAAHTTQAIGARICRVITYRVEMKDLTGTVETLASAAREAARSAVPVDQVAVIENAAELAAAVAYGVS